MFETMKEYSDFYVNLCPNLSQCPKQPYFVCYFCDALQERIHMEYAEDQKMMED